MDAVIAGPILSFEVAVMAFNFTINRKLLSYPCFYLEALGQQSIHLTTSDGSFSKNCRVF